MGIQKADLAFHHKQHSWSLETTPEIGQWLVDVLPMLQIGDHDVMTFQLLEKDFVEHCSGQFDAFLKMKEWRDLRGNGLLIL